MNLLGLNKNANERMNEPIVKKHDIALDKQVVLADKLNMGMTGGNIQSQSADNNGWSRST